MFLDDQGQLIRGSNHRGMRSVGVPGTVAGFSLALERYGTKPWATVSRRAIELADEGFLLDESLAEELAEYELDWRDQPSAAQVFLRPSGECFHAGDRWRQPELAETLARLAVQGPEDFYRGEIARRLSRGIQSEGGLITTDDLAGYRPIERAPVLGTYREFEIISMSAPSSGGATLLEMLGILEGFPLSEYAHNSPEYLHLLAETMQLAYCDRARFLGDPDADPEVLAHVTWMLDPTHHAFQRSQLSQTAHRAAAPEDLAVTASIESPQTTHFSVIDSAGNAVSVTYTLEQAYGSRLVAPGLGFLLNNQMGDFNPWPGVTDTTGLIGTPPNQIAPGKRMLSSMSPTIVVRDGQPWLIVGSPGGRTIINTVLQVILNSVDFEMPLPDAVAAPRVHHQWLPDRLEIESELARPDLLQALTTLGHATRVVEEQGRVMAIRIDGPDRRGVADPRAPSGTAAAEDFR
jgi:gamma-glutamyltranspeptidase/glutathione hydrolase